MSRYFGLVSIQGITEKEFTVLSILKRKYIENSEAYFLTKDIANSPEYLRLDDLSKEYVKGCGNVIGTLLKKDLITFAVVFDGYMPVRCYQINTNGLDVVNNITDNIVRKLKSLKENIRFEEEVHNELKEMMSDETTFEEAACTK